MTIPGSAHPNIGLGVLSIAGGTYGYLRKGSTPSLVAGVGLGGLLLTSSYLITTQETPYQGHLLASLTTSVMTAAMGRRYVATGYKFMPAGLMAGLGVVALAYNVNKAMEWAPASSTISKSA